MARWHGKVGYSETVETAPGIHTSQITVHEYTGDVLRNSSRWSDNSKSTNDNLSFNAQISIVADPFAIDNFYSMKWIEFMGVKWSISTVDPQLPRLILTLGGVHNGE